MLNSQEESLLWKSLELSTYWRMEASNPALLPRLLGKILVYASRHQASSQERKAGREAESELIVMETLDL